MDAIIVIKVKYDSNTFTGLYTVVKNFISKDSHKAPEIADLHFAAYSIEANFWAIWI